MSIRKTLLLSAIVIFALLQTAHAQNRQLSGTIRDYYSQQIVPQATVQVKQLVSRIVNGAPMNVQVLYTSTLANEQGFYSVKVPTDDYVVEVSVVGYIKKSRFINLKKDSQLDFELSEQINQLDDVEISTQKTESNVKNIEMSTIKLNVQSLKKLPVVFGESDIIRALTLQPGVTTAGEGAGGFSVRGGRTDQNLVLLDDAPIFNTSHLLGIFTSVNAEAVQNATLYKGGIPARYGGRLSSILTMTTKTSTDERRMSAGIGPVSSNLLAHVPLKNKKGAFMLAGRAAYPNLMLGAFPKRLQGSKAFFYDLNASFQYRFGSKHSLTMTAYQSYDDFKFPEDTSYFWQSRIATAQWSTVVNSKFSVSAKAILSHYTYGVKGLTKDFEYELSSKLRHHEARTDFLYQPSEAHKIEGGASVIFYRFSPGSIRPTAAQSAIVSRDLADERAREASAYLSYDWRVSKRIALQVGARYSHFSNVGPGQVFEYAPNQPRSRESIIDTIQFGSGQTNFSFGGFEPRASLKIEVSDQQSFKFSYNRTRQYLHLISNTTAISPIDYWKLSNRYIPPQMADQFSVGYYQNFKDNVVQTSVEGFYKRNNQLVEYKDGASLLLNEHLETELLNATGYSYGVELSAIKTKGRFTGSVSYTWSRSLVAVRPQFLVEQVNQGNYFPSLFDKPHNLTVSGQYFLGGGWTFAGNFLYQTGRPITYPDGQYSLNENLIFNFSARNLDRLPDYHRLDVSFSHDSRRNKTQKRYNVLNISFYNLYARKNPYSIFFRQFLSNPKSYQLAVLGTVIPSITLTFHW